MTVIKTTMKNDENTVNARGISTMESSSTTTKKVPVAQSSKLAAALLSDQAQDIPIFLRSEYNVSFLFYESRSSRCRIILRGLRTEKCLDRHLDILFRRGRQSSLGVDSLF